MYRIITSPSGLKFKAIINDYEINIGGDVYSCVEISRSVKNYLNLLSDTRKPSCFLNKNLPNNLLDAKELIRASVYILKQTDVKNCYLELIDSSNKSGVSISYASLFFQLETWYEKYFKAELINEDDKEKYKKLKDNLRSKKFKNGLNLKKVLKETNTPNDELLMNIYDNSETLFEFGQNIYKKYNNDTSKAYKLLRPWLSLLIENKLNGKFLRQNKWIILCKNVNVDGFSMKDTIPFKLKWIAKKQIGGLKRKVTRELTEKDKEMLQMPNYFIWREIKIDEYNKKDRIFLDYWYKKLMMDKFFN